MTPLVPRTLVEQAVEAIMLAAAAGDLRPGERVVEAEISRELGISRVPVREALRLLESQGLVENIPYRGMRLMTVDAEQVRNTLEVRFALERLAVEKYLDAAETRKIDLAPLRQSLDAMNQAARNGDSYGLALADTGFHRALCGLTGNRVLVDTWEPLSRRMTVIFGIAATRKAMRGIVEEHEDLLAAIERREREPLIALLREHSFSYLKLDTSEAAQQGIVRPQPS